jgi:hypothetical protein
MKALRFGAATLSLAVALLWSIAAHAANVAYLSGGAGCPLFTSGLYRIAAALTARGFETHVGCSFPIAQILARRRDNVFLIGHSYGAAHAGEACDQLAARGMRVKVIGIDALFTGARTHCAGAVHIYGQGYPMPGARNELVRSSYGHIAFTQDPNVQRRVLAAAGVGR